MWPFLILLAFKSVSSDEFFASSFAVADQCESVCKKAQIPPLDLVSGIVVKN